jgi:hypothetical protein
VGSVAVEATAAKVLGFGGGVDDGGSVFEFYGCVIVVFAVLEFVIGSLWRGWVCHGVQKVRCRVLRLRYHCGKCSMSIVMGDQGTVLLEGNTITVVLSDIWGSGLSN